MSARHWAIGFAVSCLATVAGAEDVEVRWQHPAPDEVAGFRVYWTTVPDTLQGVRDIGKPERNADGDFHISLLLPRAQPLYVHVRAYDAWGREGPASEVLRAESTAAEEARTDAAAAAPLPAPGRARLVGR